MCLFDAYTYHRPLLCYVGARIIPGMSLGIFARGDTGIGGTRAVPKAVREKEATETRDATATHSDRRVL